VSALAILFVAAFIAGLLLAVFAMLHGVEHLRRNRTRAPSPFFNLPAIAAFAIGFGAVGYPLASRTRLPPWSILLIAIASGLLATSGMITLLATWALAGAEGSSSDEHEIQGQFATVTREIKPSVAGEISYEHSGQTVRVPARLIGDASAAVGSDVVIDRIEDGVAFVEEWATVEQRL
jgi:hypothetical protein